MGGKEGGSEKKSERSYHLLLSNTCLEPSKGSLSLSLSCPLLLVPNPNHCQSNHHCSVVGSFDNGFIAAGVSVLWARVVHKCDCVIEDEHTHHTHNRGTHIHTPHTPQIVHIHSVYYSQMNAIMFYGTAM